MNLKAIPQHSSLNQAARHDPIITQSPSQTIRTPIITPHHTPVLPSSTLKSPTVENSRQKSNAAKNVTISELVQTPSSSTDIQSHENHPVVDLESEGYDGDGFESESEGSGESSEVDLDVGGERSDVEADRHDTVFGESQELDSSITNEYLRQLRYT